MAKKLTDVERLEREVVQLQTQLEKNAQRQADLKKDAEETKSALKCAKLDLKQAQKDAKKVVKASKTSAPKLTLNDPIELNLEDL